MAAENPFLQHAAPQIARLTPYVPGKPVSELEREFGITDSVKLASNENPLGCGELARAAYLACADEARPLSGRRRLCAARAIAEHHGVDAAQVTVGNGSNDVLDLIARTFLHPGRESVFSEHAFAVYAIATQAVGATARVQRQRLRPRPRRAGGAGQRADLAWSGSRIRTIPPAPGWPLEAAARFIDSLPEHCLCVIDEAYFEYVDEPDYPDTSTWLAEFPNLIVTRTFAKVHGLAALRVGYGLSHAAWPS
jgi:histidinol-phosphate aminotransferase